MNSRSPCLRLPRVGVVGQCHYCTVPGDGVLRLTPSLSFTAPGPVSDFQVTHVSIREIGLTWRSNDSESFKILTMQERGEVIQNATTRNQSIIIENLNPGTSYHFEIFPRGPDGTQGPSRTVHGRTGKCLDLEVSYRKPA